MAAGLFELRKDPITGWWVATVVDRAFHRDRFARAAEPVDDRLFGCANCSTPGGRRGPRPDAEGLRVPRRRHRRRRPRPRSGPRPGRPGAGTRDGQLADDRGAARGAPRRCTRSATRSSRRCSCERATRSSRREDHGPDRVPPGRPELGRPGRGPDQPPVPRPVRPAPDPAPDRRGAGRRGPLRHPRGGVPVLPARPRRGPAPGPARLGGRRERGLRPVRLALVVRGLGRAAPSRGRLRAAIDAGTSPRPPRRCARS